MEIRRIAIAQGEIAEIVLTPWAGSNYSRRIWKREYDIAHKVRDLMTRHILIGSDLNVVSKALAKELKLDSEKNVRRLLFTESAYIKSQADLMVYNKLGIEEYEILATLDTKTSKICRSMDGKHFRVDEAVERVNYPPFHPNCRTTTIAYEEDKGGKIRAARDKDGKSYNVPLGMKYEEWYNTYVKNDPEYLAKEKAWKNRHGDEKQYDRYRSLLKGRIPKTLEAFQKIKYLDKLKWERLKDNYYVRNNIKKGVFGSAINPEKQAPHNESTKQDGKSYLYNHVDAQKLFDQYAGTGIMELDRNGHYTNKEKCVSDDYVGFDFRSGKKTKQFKIHHSKKRGHIVPYLKEIKNEWDKS